MERSIKDGQPSKVSSDNGPDFFPRDLKFFLRFYPKLLWIEGNVTGNTHESLSWWRLRLQPHGFPKYSCHTIAHSIPSQSPEGIKEGCFASSLQKPQKPPVSTE
jgi:hypothetical protein